MVSANSKTVAFFFVDLDGSTHFKYTSCPLVWRHAFQDFYIKFQQALIAAEASEKEKLSKPFRFWKGLGDALVYALDFDNANELALASVIFQRAIKIFEPAMKVPFGLSIKSCIWFASLPGATFLLHTPQGEDYIGPDMDLGFRLASISMSERCFVAMDSVEMLSKSNLKDRFTFVHQGWKKLKGIHFENQYPVFQISHKDLAWNSSPLSDFVGTKGDFGFGEVSPEEAGAIIRVYKRNLRYSSAYL